FFFFQAEDGIRDFHVTGVQTCALPIWTRHERSIPQMGLIIQVQVPADAGGVMMTVNPLTGDAGELVIDASYGLGQSVASGEVSQIGRASCRERGWISVGAGGCKAERAV